TDDERSFAVNSSLFDMQVTGDIKPATIADLYGYWSGYFERHITHEILLDSIKTAPQQTAVLDPVQLKGQIDFKNVDIIKKYLPSFPSVSTEGGLKFQTTASSEQFEFNTEILADTLIINQTKLEGANVNIRGRFQHEKQLKEFSNFDFEAHAKSLQSTFFDMDSLQFHLQFNQDSLLLSQHIKQFSDTSSYDLELHSLFTD